ncbi:MarR family transcriptional regulator [Enterococcus ureilyticus]|uniref:HTH-type transcriptional regulator SarZ n=1 Tax=Enterococcus ureilyticus TaxID=1131292 RepID=A0A1E5HD05_9ENTE|nr:MarR family transcriptional regulator [Enterococcus ureilyticus]MBM7687656.1 DNA-binding MarR family transcriptional regulator [Enterococcus ureilyticus]OEG22827.1 MarR family transcriptional regulator [Enterococcus ureilyticus]
MDKKSRRLEEQLCFSLQTASKQFNRMYAKALKPFHLTYPQYLVLLVLWEYSDQRISDIGEKLALDTGTLTPMLKRMEKNGYIHRDRLPKDERIVIISLSEKASLLEMEIYDQVEGCLNQLDFDEKDYFLLIEQINSLSKQIGEINH